MSAPHNGHARTAARLAALLGAAVISGLACTPAPPPPAPEQLAAPAGPTVAETSTQLTLTFPNGHTVDWSKTNCGLNAWRDATGALLAAGMDLQLNMPVGYHGVYRPAPLTLQHWQVTGDKVVLSCTGTVAELTNVPFTFTLGGLDKTFGVPYHGISWQMATDGPFSNVDFGPYVVNYQNNPYGLQFIAFDPIWDGAAQYSYLRADDPDTQPGNTQEPYSLLQRPEGAYVLYVPDPTEQWSYGGFTVDPGVRVHRQFEFPAGSPPRTPTIALLWSSAAAGVPYAQLWLDARLGILHDQWRDLGLGPQHITPHLEGGCGGIQDWTWSPTTHWGQNNPGYPAYYLDCSQQFAGTGMFEADTPGGPPTRSDYLNAPDLYLPNASDLPAVIPGVTAPGQLPLQAPTGSGYTIGTVADLRNTLSLQRILGMVPGIWSREYYAGCAQPPPAPAQAQAWSRWDKTWTCSILWKLHPEWGQQRPDGSLDPTPQAYANMGHPAYQAWYQAEHDYWLSLGLGGFFKDTSCFPCTGSDWYQGTQQPQLRFSFQNLVHLLQGGGSYFVGEAAPLWGYGWQDKSGNPKFQKYEEWLYFWSQHNWGAIARGTVAYPDAEMAWDDRAATRSHTVWGATGTGPSGSGFDRPIFADPASPGQYVTQAAHYSHMVERYGQPDRIILSNLRPAPYSTSLEQPATAGQTHLEIHNKYYLPVTGLVQIDNEQLYIPDRLNRAGACTTPSYGCLDVQGVLRGQNGTAAAAHGVNATVRALGDIQHWDWDDAEWEYGQGAQAVRVRYSDEVVTRGTLPQITNVQVTSTGTVQWDTDVPTASWVEYDTYGAVEGANSQRHPDIWPTYAHKSDLLTGDLPLSTSHTVTLNGLTPNALYHYRIVARGPAPAVTLDATFTSGAAAPQTATPPPLPGTPSATPTLTATAGTATRTATRTATPVPVPPYSVQVAPASAAPGAAVQVTLHDATPRAWDAWERVGHTSNEWGFLSCTQIGPNPPGVTDAVCTIAAPSTAGSYTYRLLDTSRSPAVELARSNVLTITSPATATATATSTPLPAPTSTATSPATPSPTTTSPATATPLTPTATATATGTPVPTATATAPATGTPLPTATLPPPPTAAPTEPPAPTATATAAPTSTPPSTPTSTPTAAGCAVIVSREAGPPVLVPQRTTLICDGG